MTDKDDGNRAGGRSEDTPPHGIDAEGLAERDLESVFRKWEAERDTVAPPPGMSFDDLPLTAEELALDHEVARSPEAMIARARRAALYRLLFVGVLFVACAATLWINRHDFDYWLQDPTAVDLGDLRQHWRAGERPGDGTWPAMASNTFVSFENGIMTEERESSAGTYYFFEPMMKALVVTARALPDKNPRTAAIHASFAGLVNKRWVLVSDMSAGFSGRGRLLRASDAPLKYKKFIAAYTDYLRLGERMGQDETLWLFLDGVEPKGQRIYLWIYGVAFFVLLLSLVFWWRARKRLALLQESLASTRTP